MDVINEGYLFILETGLVAVRNALAIGDNEYASIEAEHLHEIPSLLITRNRKRDQYYLSHTVALYLESIKAKNREDIALHAGRSYFGVWDRMRDALKEMQGDSGPALKNQD